MGEREGKEGEGKGRERKEGEEMEGRERRGKGYGPQVIVDVLRGSFLLSVAAFVNIVIKHHYYN